jgi:hypothetical protein
MRNVVCPRLALSVVILGSVTQQARSAAQWSYDTSLTSVITNGPDTVNPGPACITIAASVSSNCQGYIAIPANSKDILAAALASKISGNKITLIYEDQAALVACTGYVWTTCSAISLQVK